MTERPSGRAPHELRDLSITPILDHPAEGAVVIKLGRTQVLCTASLTEGVPRFLKDSKQGWLTAEYSMLPRSTHTRNDRESVRGKLTGRTTEIQRLIGRTLRSAIDLKKLRDHTVVVDCDVLVADGGTRTAAITGGMTALVMAIQKLQYQQKLKTDPIRHLMAAISVGVSNGDPVLDLDYDEDCVAETDCNIIMTENNEFVEIQGTAEGKTFSREELNSMLALAESGIQQLITVQRDVLAGRVDAKPLVG